MASVETFSETLTVKCLPPKVAEIEALLLDSLDSPERLLRWAVVKVLDTSRILCEGAYLKY
ncbi:MAG: hypothetical protein KTR14_06485 [Vampirovibrio sp.]|nr:hypothetical protein [Vampirovibrio sp.]